MTKINFNKIAIILFSLLSSLQFISCIGEIKNPVLPIWELESYLPLAYRSETLKELIKNEKNIFVDSSTMLLKFDSLTTKSITINEMFKDEIHFNNHYVVKPAQANYVSFQTFIYDDSVYLQEAKINYGTLNYRVINYLDKQASAIFKIPGCTKNNDTLTFSVNLPPKTAVENKIDLSKYNYKQLATNPLNNPHNGILVVGTVAIENGYSGDSISFDVKLDSLAFSYFKGKSKPYTTKIKEKTNYIDIDQDIKDILPKVDVKGARVVINSNSTINNLQIALKNMQVVGIFKDGTPEKILKINNKNSLDSTISLTQPLTLSIDNFSINQFLNPKVPDSITIRGDITINPNNLTMEIGIQDTIEYSYRLEIVSILKIDDASKTDTLKIDSLKQKEKNQLDNMIEASLTFEIDNGIPVGFQIVGYLTDVNYNKLFYITRQIGDGSLADTVFSVLPAPVNADGEVTGSSANQVKQIKLQKPEFQKLKEARYLIYRVVGKTTDSKLVYVRGSNRYSIRLYGKILTKIDTESMRD